jgi:hypothetical protein
MSQLQTNEDDDLTFDARAVKSPRGGNGCLTNFVLEMVRKGEFNKVTAEDLETVLGFKKEYRSRDDQMYYASIIRMFFINLIAAITELPEDSPYAPDYMKTLCFKRVILDNADPKSVNPNVVKKWICARDIIKALSAWPTFPKNVNVYDILRRMSRRKSVNCAVVTGVINAGGTYMYSVKNESEDTSDETASQETATSGMVDVKNEQQQLPLDIFGKEKGKKKKTSESQLCPPDIRLFVVKESGAIRLEVNNVKIEISIIDK